MMCVLATIEIKRNDVTEDNFDTWIAGMVDKYGKMFDVLPLSKDEQEHVDPVKKGAWLLH